MGFTAALEPRGGHLYAHRVVCTAAAAPLLVRLLATQPEAEPEPEPEAGADEGDGDTSAKLLPAQSGRGRPRRSTSRRGPTAAANASVAPAGRGRTLVRALLAPAAALAHVRLWPMDGALADLVAPGRTVLAEVYPRAAYTWPLGFPPAGWSKRRQADRRARGAQARQWMSSGGRGITPDRAMQAALDDGFGPAPSGEDPFDATMGALQMIAVLDGLLPGAPPALMDATGAQARATEGWILGRPAS
jgi:hypothetical protein